jgi:hypothetical protein
MLHSLTLIDWISIALVALTFLSVSAIIAIVVFWGND